MINHLYYIYKFEIQNMFYWKTSLILMYLCGIALDFRISFLIVNLSTFYQIVTFLPQKRK